MRPCSTKARSLASANDLSHFGSPDRRQRTTTGSRIHTEKSHLCVPGQFRALGRSRTWWSPFATSLGAAAGNQMTGQYLGAAQYLGVGPRPRACSAGMRSFHPEGCGHGSLRCSGCCGPRYLARGRSPQVGSSRPRLWRGERARCRRPLRLTTPTYGICSSYGRPILLGPHRTDGSTGVTAKTSTPTQERRASTMTGVRRVLESLVIGAR